MTAFNPLDQLLNGDAGSIGSELFIELSATVEHSVESDLVQPFEGHTCEAFSDRFIGHICKVSVPPESLARLRAPWQVRLKLGRATGSASVKTE